MLSINAAVQDTLDRLGVIARVVRYRRGQPRDLYHFHQADIYDQRLWQVVLRYRGRFAGICLYVSGALLDGPVTPAAAVAEAVEWALTDVEMGNPWISPINRERAERTLSRLKAFLGPAGYWEIVNAVEENGR